MVGDDVKNLFGLFIKSKGSDSIDKFFRRNVATVIVGETFFDVYFEKLVSNAVWLRFL